jgi:NitT/TauT family transport system permease protein
VFPGPQAVAEKVIELVGTDAFQQHVWSSLWILLYGLVPALVLAVFVGAAVGASPIARWLFGPLVITLAAAPLVVLLPLLVTWMGLGNGPKILLVFLLGMFPAANAILVRWPKLRVAPRDVGELDDDGFPAPQRPGGRAAAIFAGLRVGLVSGVIALVIAELVSSNTGVAYFVVMSGSMFNTAEAMAAALMVMVPTAVLGVFLQAIEEQLAP